MQVAGALLVLKRNDGHILRTKPYKLLARYFTKKRKVETQRVSIIVLHK